MVLCEIHISRKYASRAVLLLAQKILVERTGVARLFVLDGDVPIGREGASKDGDVAKDALKGLVEDVGCIQSSGWR